MSVSNKPTTNNPTTSNIEARSKFKGFNFETNIHKLERGVRVVAGLGLLSLAFVGPANPWFFLGAIPLMTGLIGWCPPYAMLGINTCHIGQGSKRN